MTCRYASAIPSSAWRYRDERCATCGARPDRPRYSDGSPSYSCRHDPLEHVCADHAPDTENPPGDTRPGGL